MKQEKTKKNHVEIDFRDIARFLLGKLWIIAVVAVCFTVIAFLYTSYGIKEQYSSTTEMFIIDTSANGSTTSDDWNVGQNITMSSAQIIKGDIFCQIVADKLNNKNVLETIYKTDDKGNVEKDSNGNPIIEENVTVFSKFLGESGKDVYTFYEWRGRDITWQEISSSLTVNASEDSPLFSVTATTSDPELSALISNSVLYYYRDFVTVTIMQDYDSEFIKALVYNQGKINTTPSNISWGTNLVVAFLIGFVLAAAVLVIIFLFDDKIKTPDDVEKHLGISVLGAIPEIE